MPVLSTVETNHGLTIPKKHQEELNSYLLSTTQVSYQLSSNMKTISLAFVSFCHKVLEEEVIFS